MAHAEKLKSAPSKTQPTAALGAEPLNDSQALLLEFDFDPAKRYVFELAVRAPERERPIQVSLDGMSWVNEPTSGFIPYRNIVLTSQIVWKGQRRNIRYYDGCDSVFVNEQPREKELIDSLIQGTNRDRLRFLDGYFTCEGYEAMLLLYLYLASFNVDSPYRTKSAHAIWRPLDKSKMADTETERLDRIERAMAAAREASEGKMRMHAAYLGIPVLDEHTGNEKGEKELRVDYKKFALQHTDTFLKSYGDPAIELRHYLRKALETGVVKADNGRATWKSGTAIVELGGLSGMEAIADRLYEFSQTEAGEDFLLQMKAIYADK